MKPDQIKNKGLDISAKRLQLHLNLLKAALLGIVVPQHVHKELEKVFQGISDRIKIGAHTTEQPQQFWIMLNVLKYDPMVDDVVPCKWSDKHEN